MSIVVIGIGGGAGKAINHMLDSGFDSVDYIAIDTDKQALEESKARTVIQIGKNDAFDFDAHTDSDMLGNTADENCEEVLKAVRGAGIVIILAGMGGGTGTNAVSAISDIVKQAGILTIAIVTKPFSFEKKIRQVHADNGIAALKTHCDSLIVISSYKLGEVEAQDNVTILQQFRLLDDHIFRSIQGISGILEPRGLLYHAFDVGNFKIILKDAGATFIGSGRAAGAYRAIEAAKKAARNQLSDMSIGGAKYVIILVAGDVDLGIDEVEYAVKAVDEIADKDAVVFFDAAFNDALENKIEVTILAAGYRSDSE